MTGSAANLIPFLKLYRREGDRGPVYLGRMNGLALRGFERLADQEGGNPYIELYVSISGSQENAAKKLPAPAGAPGDRLQQLPSDRIERANHGARRDRGDRGGTRASWGKPARSADTPSPAPFYDDDISDIGAAG